MSHRHSFEHRNLIPDHMFPSGHQPLVNDFGRVVSTGLDVYAFLHHAVRSRTEGFARLVTARLDLGGR